MTPAQRRALEAVRDIYNIPGPDGRVHHNPVHPREVAHRLWPDSPAWEKRTRRYGSNRNGAMGGTMPMNAAKILYRLREQGLVETDWENGWWPSHKGYLTLETT